MVVYYTFNQGTASGDNGSGCPPPGIPCVNTLEDGTANNNDGTLTNFALSGGSSNWVSGAPALPVELTAFKAVAQNQKVQLMWQTRSELNNEGFQIERSPDGKDWERLGFVPGRGTTFAGQSYAFTDDYPFVGVNYYRLQQIDFDGVFEYSEVIRVTVDKAMDIEIFPNPTNGHLQIVGVETGKISIIDCFGRIVKAGPFNTPEVDLSNLLSGVYVLQVEADRQLIREWIIKE